MRAHDDDWVPLSVIGSHVRTANPEFDPRTYGCAKLVEERKFKSQLRVAYVPRDFTLPKLILLFTLT